MRFCEIVFAVCAAMPAFASAQGVIPTNNAAIFSAQPVQTPSGTTTGTLATRWGNRLDLVADFGADPTGHTDISAALSAAIATGKPIFIPAGTFLWSGAVNIPGNTPVDIVCADSAQTTINMSGSFVYNQPSPYLIYHVSVQNCGFNVTGAGQFSFSQYEYNNSVPQESLYFANNYWNVESTSTASPVILLNNISGSQFHHNRAQTLSGNIFIQITGTSMNNEFDGDQFINYSSVFTSSNIGLDLEGNDLGGVQGTRIENEAIWGYGIDVKFGQYINTVVVNNSMFDQGHLYAMYIGNTTNDSVNQVYVSDSYMATEAAASSGDAAVYIEHGAEIKFSHNSIGAYNSGNYSIDMTNALSGTVSIFNNSLAGSINNPNNIAFEDMVSQGPIQAPNLLWGSNTVISSATTLTTVIAGESVFFTNTSPITVTLPEASSMQPGSIVYFQNNGSANVTFAVPADDTNQMPNGSDIVGGTSVLQPGAAFYGRPNSTIWSAYGYDAEGIRGIPSSVTVNGALAAASATINGIAVGVTPSVATLGTNPPVSGTAYQWAGPGTLQLACPITYSPTSTAAATSTLDIGSTSTPSNAVDTESEPAAITAGMTHTAHAEVPAGWYYELSATNATIGTCVGIVH